MSYQEAALQQIGCARKTEGKKNGLLKAGRFFYRQGQNSLRPLFAAMRMRRALSLMKPAASAWL
ncbi:hypothetical protein EDB98_11054 [Pseudomonas fluorescens]|nr:hypothetical protein EDB98_11054 [Pseudomonas fluorescens]SFW66073.1 hypothetical protein SAMN03159439_03460 [Pseudomonas sp. NFACC04-2]